MQRDRVELDDVYLMHASMNVADDVGGLAQGVESMGQERSLFRRDDEDQTDPHVECTEHFRVGNLTALLNQSEDWGHRPCAPLDRHAAVGRKNSRNIIVETAAGYMRHPFNLKFGH